jgi:hypothetical protein
MKTLAALAVLFSGSCMAQDATTMLGLLNLIRHPPTQFLTLTASQGDGSTITLSKFAGPTVSVSMVATGMSETTISGAAMGNGYVISVGDAMCLLLSNTTAAAIPAQGSWPAIPVSSVAWQCSTNIRTSGQVTGQTPLVVGVVSWP